MVKYEKNATLDGINFFEDLNISKRCMLTTQENSRQLKFQTLKYYTYVDTLFI